MQKHNKCVDRSRKHDWSLVGLVCCKTCGALIPLCNNVTSLQELCCTLVGSVGMLLEQTQIYETRDGGLIPLISTLENISCLLKTRGTGTDCL